MVHVVLARARDPQGQEGQTQNGTLDLLGVLFHNREGVIDLGETVVGQRVRLFDIGLYVSVRPLGIREEGRHETMVPLIGEGKGLLAIGV